MKRTLNSNSIKIIAIIAMTIDHIAWLLFPGYPREIIPIAMHIVGRITCPIMCYFVAEGYHSKNISRYTHRLFLFFSSPISLMFSSPPAIWIGSPLSPSITEIFWTRPAWCGPLHGVWSCSELPIVPKLKKRSNIFWSLQSAWLHSQAIGVALPVFVSLHSVQIAIISKSKCSGWFFM